MEGIETHITEAPWMRMCSVKSWAVVDYNNIYVDKCQAHLAAQTQYYTIAHSLDYQMYSTIVK